MEKLVQKNKRLRVWQKLAATTGAAACLTGVLSMMVGCFFGLDADVGKMNIGSDSLKSEEYQSTIREDIDRLCTELSEGKISYSQFKEQYEELHSIDKGYAFAKENNLNGFESRISENEEDRAIANGLWNVGPIVETTGLATIAGYFVCDGIVKSRSKKIGKLMEELENESELAD